MSLKHKLFGKAVQTSHKRLKTRLCATIEGRCRIIHTADVQFPEFAPESLQGTACKGLSRLVATFGHGVTCS